jgi:hypothetical protein
MQSDFYSFGVMLNSFRAYVIAVPVFHAIELIFLLSHLSHLYRYVKIHYCEILSNFLMNKCLHK